MSFYEKGPVRIHYEEHGSGFPLLLIAGGGLNSTISGLTSGSPFNPIEEFKGEYRCIASDLRNANGGQSTGPLEVDRPWDSFADDQLGLPFPVLKYRVSVPPIGRIMATRLKTVDVAVIGLGAAGGVAVLPLARAGLKVAGIEAGTWMGPKDYRSDEIYNNVRRRVTSVPKAQREIPTVPRDRI